MGVSSYQITARRGCSVFVSLFFNWVGLIMVTVPLWSVAKSGAETSEARSVYICLFTGV